MVAAFVPRAFNSAASAGVEVPCWFSSQDSVDGAMGLRNNDGKRRKAFGALQTLTREIGGYVFVRVVGQDHPTVGVPSLSVSWARMNNKLVIWNIDGDSSVVFENLANAKIEVRDVQRLPVTVKYGDDGAVKLLANRAPIYVAAVRNVTIDLSLSAAEPTWLGL